MSSLPVNRPLRILFCLLAVLCANIAQADWSEVPKAIRHDLGLPESGGDWTTVYEASSGAINKSAKQADSELPMAVTRWRSAHLGDDRIFFQVDFDQEVINNRTTLIFYLDVDHNPETGRMDEAYRGVDMMLVIADNNLVFLNHSSSLSERNVQYRGRAVGKSLYLLFDAPILGKEDDHVRMRGLIIGEIRGRSSTNTKFQEISLPLVQQKASSLPKIPLPTRMTVDGFRYIDQHVAYEDLENRGLSEHQLVKIGVTYGRPRPLPTYDPEGATPSKKQSKSAPAPVSIPVRVKEEIGISRPQGRVHFGFPLPQGHVFDPRTITIKKAGVSVGAVVQGTSRWPDGSLKWAVIDFLDSFAEREEVTYQVIVGSDAEGKETRSGGRIALKDTADQIVIDTGTLGCIISKTAFKGPERLFVRDGDQWKQVATSPVGFELTDQKGVRYTTSAAKPKSVSMEENTPQRVTLRIVGDYATDKGQILMSYVTRLSFHAGSSRIDVAHTHINSELSREFTDIQSLEYRLQPNLPSEAAISSSLVVYQGDGKGIDSADRGIEVRSGKETALLQFTDQMSSLSLDAASPSAGQESDRRNPGGLRINLSDGGINLAITDFWQRWPKGIRSNAKEGLTLLLLPEAPDREFGKDLPFHLMFPLVEGYYRMKWGMSFTERFIIDLSKNTGPEQTWAEAQWPLIAVLPPEWYAQTGAYMKLAVPRGSQFTLWDQYAENSLAEHWKLKDKNREYGFLNYGDWFGERKRNWGNNEYDLPHVLFAQFVRTGNRDFYRLAIRGARHQADVDIVHAYPDPFFVGANPEHSVGHTGNWSEKVESATWSMAYNVSSAAGNGHTWADGMIDAWCLGADPVVMESALMLGEHINYAFAPSFNRLGDHERTAGWSMRAAMALYRGTSDPLYLESAGRIGEVALKQQDLKKTGVWPHVLPLQHASGQPNVMGNNVFLIGVLLGGLQTYHALTGDERYATSLKAAGKWLSRNWDPETAAWAYSVTTDDKPAAQMAPALSPLIYGSLLYSGVLLDDQKMIEQTKKSMETLFSPGSQDSFGKDFSFKGFFTGEIMGYLQEWMDKSGNSDDSFLAAPESK